MSLLKPVYISSTKVGELRIADWGVVFDPAPAFCGSARLSVITWETEEAALLAIRREVERQEADHAPD